VSSDSAEDPYVGRVIAGRYEVVRKLNQGGMGAVYLAMQRPLDRPVALKLLLRAHADDPLAARRFEKEARAVSRLTHPHVVTLYDFGSTESGELYIAMEYLQGNSLRDLIAAPPGFVPWDRALHIVRGVTAALVSAHAAGIIHRDLKPENVMLVERTGEVDFPIVLDFGLAKSMEPDVRGPITQRDIIPGTPAYMSPERANGIADDPRSDLYALGAMWFELLVGQPPFAGESSIKVILRHIHETPPAPSKANTRNAIPSAVDEVVLQLLEKHPDKRPKSASELLERLDALHRPRGWHVSNPGSVAHHTVADEQLKSYAIAVSELDDFDFSLEEEEPFPLVRRKTDPRMAIPMKPPDPAMSTQAIASKPMPAPVSLEEFPLPGVTVPAADAPMLLTRPKEGVAPAAKDTQVAALHLLVQPKRSTTSPPRPSGLRITSIADVSSHMATAKTARDVAELSVAFLATRFDRAVVADLRNRNVLASTGIVDGEAFLGAVLMSSSMHEMLLRKDAFYGATPNTPDWMSFFRRAVFGGVQTGGAASSLPGAMFIATLKRDGAPAFLFYGDHRDVSLRSDVKDAVILLREAANAFSLVSL
jgi:serine/threonine protein kinase